MLSLITTYPLEIPPPAEKPLLGRSTRFSTRSTLPVSAKTPEDFKYQKNRRVK